MSTFKKLLALTLALAMVLSVSAFAGYQADTYKDAASIDEDCEDAVELLYALDIMVGSNDEFRPTANITRAEIAKMIYVILNYGNDDKAVNYTGANLFSDVEKGSWYEGYVNYCASIKLIQGDGTGKFNPNANVTTAAVAKMLLTAIGYSAEARGYVGANWDKNVLSDAAILGLLDGCKENVNGYATRQWVAVMFYNMLSCYTYQTMYPSFSGLLTSGTDLTNDPVTMGYKFYGLKTFTSTAIATKTASIDTYAEGKTDEKEFASASGKVLFANGLEVKGTGLGAMDLGQTYRVIYKAGTNNVAYSVRSLYETAEARALDIDVDVTYGTSSNKANNKYIFTVEDVEAKFAAAEINVLYTGTTQQETVGAKTIKVTEFYKLVNEPAASNDTYKVILNDDGQIEYIIVTNYDYAQVTKAATHNRYGDYVNVADKDDKDLKFNELTNLYIDDCIICEDELVKGNIVKYTWDLDEHQYAMEVLPTVEDAEYTAIDKKASPRIYTVGGEDYYVAEKDMTDSADWFNDTKNLDEEICLVVDGDLIVYHWFSDSDYDNMDDINAQLALLIDADSHYSNGTIHVNNAIEYMTIDGDTHIAIYLDYSEETKAAYAHAASWEQVQAIGQSNKLEGRLFIFHETSSGVWLEMLDAEDVNDQLSASTSLLNLYEEKEDKTLDATGSAVKFDGDTMASDNAFFYGYFNSSNKVAFGVITPADFGDGKDTAAYGQLLSFEKSSSGRTTVLGGYVAANLKSDTDSNFLYITEIGRETSDGWKLTVQVLGEDDTRDIVVEGEEFYTDLLYAFTYKTMDDEWTLELVDEYTEADGDNEDGYNKGFWAERNVKWYDEDVYEICLSYKRADKTTVLDVSDSDVDYIVVTTIEFVRDETQSGRTDIDWLNNKDNLDSYSRVLEVVDYEDLTADAIENGADTASYEQSSYWFYNAKADVLYIVVVRDMTQAQ